MVCSRIAVVAASTLILGALPSGCGESEPKKTTAAPPPEAARTFSGVMLTSAPEGAGEVVALKASAKEGEKVVIRGRVGGAEQPFNAERAMFTIVDASIQSCGEMDDADHCKTPWDYCCEPKENMAAGTATIQVVDASGALVKSGLEGRAGLKPLAEVVVVGTVGPRPDPGAFVINATGIFVKAE